VSFQAENTLGRRIAERQPVVRIYGEEFALRAEVEVMDEFSAHADRDGLVQYVAGMNLPRLKKVFIVHSELDAAQALVEPLKALYEAVPDPKIVIAVGACAVGGGPWFDTYNVVGGVDKIIPVDLYVPGCPPKPEAIIHGVATLLKIAEKKVAPVRESQPTPDQLAAASRPDGDDEAAGPRS